MRDYMAEKPMVLAGAIFLMVALLSFVMTGSLLGVEGLIIVVGGSVANALLSYRREDVIKAFDAIKHMLEPLQEGQENLHQDIKQFISWAYTLQADDFVGLEKDSAREKLEPFQRYGMDLAVSGYQPEKIREMMQTVADAEFERRTAPVTVLRNMAATAPAFGMVGTLIGMVILMRDVGTDVSSMGGGLAIAMLATLYGLLAARLICLPAADKLLQKVEAERFRGYMLTEGFTILSQKQNPFYMLDRLNSFLEPSKHFDLQTLKQRAFSQRYAMAA